jgi:hypothetical protein
MKSILITLLRYCYWNTEYSNIRDIDSEKVG